MEGYTDTVILECNRKSSPEYLSGNTTSNSTWMNTLGTGVTLDVGDTIQVESAYVSAIGNEASTIEIKGRTFEVSRSSSQIEINASFEENAFVGETELTSDAVGTYRWNATMGKKEYYLKDNEINLTQSYYKNANAEYYLTLPRMAAVNGAFNDQFEGIGTTGLTTINTAKNDSGMMANWYAYNSSRNGSVNKPNPFRLGTDYNAVSYDKPFLNLTDFESNSDYPVSQAIYRNLGIRQECINDGSRHTLFVRDKFSNNASDKDDYPLSPLRDPALFNWIWYKDTNTYNVNIGFNSPQNVATQMTDQMSDITELERLNIMRTANNEKSMRVVNIQGETQSLKLFPCATPVNFYNQHVSGSISTSNSPAECYLNINSPSLKENSLDSTKWDNYLYGYDANWTSVGFKRPELQETGRNMSVDVESKSYSFKIANYDSSASLQDQKIVYPSSSDTNASWGYQEILPLDLDWSPDNLKLLKDYFDAQGLYPELFNYEEMSASQQEYAFDVTNYPNASSKINVNQSRYIHMNRENLDINRVSFKIGIDVDAGDFVISTSDTLPTDMKLGDKMTAFSDPTLFNLDKGETFIVALDRTSSPNTITLSSSFASTFQSDGTETFDFSQRILGNDNYFEGTTNDSTECAAAFFDYDSSRSEIASGGSFPSELYYGFAIKYINKLKEEKIGLSLKSFGLARGFFDTEGEINLGLSKTFYDTGDPPEETIRINYETTRELGFDKHFNAYGTCAILLYNGDANSNDPPYITATNTRREGNASGTNPTNTNLEQYPRSLQVWQEREIVEGYETGALNGSTPTMLGHNCGANPYSAQAKYKNHVYIGADDPLFDFDGNQSRFFFQRLHTAERVGNLYNSTPDTEAGDGDLIVYKINKRLRFTNYSPNFIPYNRNEVEAKLYDANASALPVKMTPLDKNIVPFSIMDSHSGIQFEDYGVDEKHWRNSLWELLGFSYNQLHSSKANRTARVEARGLTSQFATTNAEILSADFVNYNLNQYGVVKYDPTQVAMSRWFCQDNSKTFPYTEVQPDGGHLELTKSYYAGRWYGYADYPTIVQSCSSVKIVAENLPRKMLSPIYLIKSDVISPEYVGGPEGKSKLPIVAIVPKNSGYGDFYNGGQGTVFTNTIPRTIQNITTTIMDADGTEARVDDASCVLYKITKQIASTDQVIQDILNPKPK